MTADSNASPRRRRLRVVVEAFGCRPGSGSEPGVGWNVTQALAAHHDIWVITTRLNRRWVAQAARADERVRIVYADPPPALQWLLPRRGLHFLHSYLWPWFAYRTARRLHRARRFDVAPRLTLATWRYPSFLHRLRIPFVWGPLGGADHVPRCLRRELGWRGRLWESVRAVAQGLGRLDPFVRSGLRRADAVLAVSSSTRRFLSERYGRDAIVLPAAGVDVPQNVRVASCGISVRTNACRTAGSASREATPFTVVSIGVLEPLKATALSLRAFAAARSRLPAAARLFVVGDGSERARLEQLAASLHLGDAVVFRGHLSQCDVFDVLDHADVMLFPSLRNAGGMAMLEALARGVPVVALDHAGPASLLPRGAGVRIVPNIRDRVVAEMGEALCALAGAEQSRKSMGRTAQRAMRTLTWARKADAIARLYRSIARVAGPETEESTQSAPRTAPITLEEPRRIQWKSRCDTHSPRSRSSLDSSRSRRTSKQGPAGGGASRRNR